MVDSLQGQPRHVHLSVCVCCSSHSEVESRSSFFDSWLVWVTQLVNRSPGMVSWGTNSAWPSLLFSIQPSGYSSPCHVERPWVRAQAMPQHHLPASWVTSGARPAQSSGDLTSGGPQSITQSSHRTVRICCSFTPLSLACHAAVTNWSPWKCCISCEGFPSIGYNWPFTHLLIEQMFMEHRLCAMLSAEDTTVNRTGNSFSSEPEIPAWGVNRKSKQMNKKCLIVVGAKKMVVLPVVVVVVMVISSCLIWANGSQGLGWGL